MAIFIKMVYLSSVILLTSARQRPISNDDWKALDFAANKNRERGTPTGGVWVHQNKDKFSTDSFGAGRYADPAYSPVGTSFKSATVSSPVRNDALAKPASNDYLTRGALFGRPNSFKQPEPVRHNAYSSPTTLSGLPAAQMAQSMFDRAPQAINDVSVNSAPASTSAYYGQAKPLSSSQPSDTLSAERPRGLLGNLNRYSRQTSIQSEDNQPTGIVSSPSQQPLLTRRANAYSNSQPIAAQSDLSQPAGGLLGSSSRPSSQKSGGFNLFGSSTDDSDEEQIENGNALGGLFGESSDEPEEDDDFNGPQPTLREEYLRSGSRKPGQKLESTHTRENIALAQRIHNKYRAAHGAQPLTWRQDLADAAKQYATYLAASKITDNSQLIHNGNHTLGENFVYTQAEGEWTTKEYLTYSINAWYREIRDYRWFGKEKPRRTRKVVGHFTQLVWKNSQFFGCWVADSEGFYCCVCNYDPPGNRLNQYKKNVGPKEYDVEMEPDLLHQA